MRGIWKQLDKNMSIPCSMSPITSLTLRGNFKVPIKVRHGLAPNFACVQSCRHPRTQAPMHARTQAPAYARRRPSTQPHTHTRKHICTLAPMHALRHPHMLADDLASMHAHNTRAHKRARMRT